MNPFNAAGLAANVVEVLATLGGPIAGWLKSRWVRRKVRKVLKRASAKFVAEHPVAAEAIAGSPEAIAQEVGRLTQSGRPVAASTLAEEWVASGRLDRAIADRFAVAYVQRLHDELMKVDGFREVLAIGAAVSAAETLERINAAQQETKKATRAQEEREVAVLHFEAGTEYFRAALALLDGEKSRAMETRVQGRNPRRHGKPASRVGDPDEIEGRARVVRRAGRRPIRRRRGYVCTRQSSER